MKSILFIFLLLSLGSDMMAQKVYPTKNLDAYVGIWKYQKNDTIFRIILQKGQNNGRNSIYNGLYGGYMLKIKGNMVENFWTPLPTAWNSSQPKPNNLYLWASNSSYSTNLIDPNYIGVIFYDQKKKHFGGKGITGGYIRLLAPNKIQWKLNEKTGIQNEMDMEEREEMIKPIGFSVPSDVIMIKEE